MGIWGQKKREFDVVDDTFTFSCFFFMYAFMCVCIYMVFFNEVNLYLD